MGLLLVIHPTQFCNLDCRYCWAPERTNKTVLPLTVLHAVLRQIASRDCGPVEVCWLTGEPLAAGIDYFADSVRMVKDVLACTDVRRLLIQTNGTLINPEWASFFAEEAITVGVSVDGPKALHDRQRRGRGGQSTHEATLRGIELLMSEGVRGGALCVISKDTLEADPDELFAFFHDRGIAWSYLIEAKIGENAQGSRALDDSDLPRLRKFLKRLMELWGSHQGAYIRDFDQVARRMFGIEEDYSLDNLGCLDILNLLPTGDFFWGNPELMTATMGPLNNVRWNLSKLSIWEAKMTDDYDDLKKRTHDGIEACKAQCSFFSTCRGGNPAHKFYTTGRFNVSDHLTCRLNDQTIAPLMLELLHQESEALV